VTADLTWPYDRLPPQNISVDPTIYSGSGGRTLSGKEQVIVNDAGYWEITLDSIQIRTNDDVLLWRSIESGLKGRAKTILIPAYDRKFAPVPAGLGSITAILSGDVAVGAVQMNIELIAGGTIEAGQDFSVGERLHRIKEVLSSSGDIYTVKVFPPARDAMSDNDPVEFDRPVCRCRLKDERGMDVTLELLKYATPTVAFCEDV
jgi:hypothetical protein